MEGGPHEHVGGLLWEAGSGRAGPDGAAAQAARLPPDSDRWQLVPSGGLACTESAPHPASASEAAAHSSTWPLLRKPLPPPYLATHLDTMMTLKPWALRSRTVSVMEAREERLRLPCSARISDEVPTLMTWGAGEGRRWVGAWVELGWSAGQLALRGRRRARSW